MENEEKYPKNFQEFLEDFPDKNACRQYLFNIRWPDDYVCQYCGSKKFWTTSKQKLHCSVCEKENSIISRTIFEKTKKPLLLWVHIMWWVVAQKTGVSAYNLMDFMGFGSYESAWTWLHKLRKAMVRPKREKLSGTVEADKTYIGGEEIGTGRKGRGADEKCLVIVTIECIGKQIGRVTFKIIPNASSENLIPFIEENVELGSNIITDGWSGYKPLLNMEHYKHEVKTISGSGKKAPELLPYVHMVDYLVKRWINGTHQSKISAKYLEYYLDEFAFRFSRKLSTPRGKLFYRLMQQAVTTPPATYNDVIN